MKTNMSVYIVTRLFIIVVPREDMNAQSMKVSSMLVISVTTNLLIRDL